MKKGTRILIKETCDGCRGAEDRKGVVTDKQNTDGLSSHKNGYNVELENGRVWRINEDAKIDILFDKSQLRDGVIVERRDGMFAIVIGDYTYSNIGYNALINYTDNLKSLSRLYGEFDIMAIYEPNGRGSIDDIMSGKHLSLIASRPEEVKEMTLEQICEELGYNVKIVKEA